MDGFVDFFLSINKIALFAFFVVLGFLIYEIKKIIDDKKKLERPTIPQFNDTITTQPATFAHSTPLPPLPKKEKQPIANNYFLMIVLGVLSLIGVIILMIVTFNTDRKKKQLATTPIPIVREIQSAGLKIYDSTWREIDAENKLKAVPGASIFIGIKTIVEADIDRARIKINSDEWQIADITTLFNQQHKVYYKEYTVATGTAQLKIEAQLHSASDGWLGD